MSGKKNRGPSVSAELEEEFFKAAENGEEEHVRECLKKGVDVNAISIPSWKRTALHMAAEGGYVNVAKLLIAKGADINTKDGTSDRETPLHIAASQGELHMVQLLVSTPGVDVLAKNEDGKTALELSGTDQMIRSVLKKREQDQRQSELMAKTGGVKIKRRIKVFVVGHGKVGKTTLIKALERILPLKELLKRDVTQPYVPTPGIEVEIVRIPGVGEASVWDFAGQTQFYVTHAMLLDARNTIYIVNYKSTDGPDVQKGQVHQWLCSIKACNADPTIRPDVVLVATHGDMLMDKEGGKRRAETILREMSGMFRTHLNIADQVIVMDCRKSHTSEMTQLKKCLHSLHEALLRKQQDMPKLCAEIIKRVPEWCKSRCNPKGPVMDWDTYRRAVKDPEFNPAVEENFLQKSTEHLHDQAEIIMVRKSASRSDSIVILKPSWLGKDVFGPTLAPENFAKRLRRTAEDLVTRDEIYRVFEDKSDPELVITLLQRFQLCHSYNGKEFVFPSLLTQEMPKEAWLPTGEPMTLYFGKAWRCRDLTDMFSSDFFPRVQTLLMTSMSNRPILWKGGAKCFDSDVEALVQMSSEGRTVYICTRSVEGDRERCHHMMRFLEKLVVGVLQESSPGTDTTQLILSARALKEHRDDLLKYAYTLEQVKVAKAESVALVNRTGGYSEKVIDVMCKTSRHRTLSHSSSASAVPIPGWDERGISTTSSQSGSPTSIVGNKNMVVIAAPFSRVIMSGSGVSSAADDDSGAGIHEWQEEVFTAMETEEQSAEPTSPTLTVVEGDDNTVVTAGDGSFVSVRTQGDGQDMEGVENSDVEADTSNDVVDPLDPMSIELD